MADEFLPHIFIKDKPDEISYSGFGFSNDQTPERDRLNHGEFLKKKFENLWASFEKRSEERKAASLPTRDGVYIEFIGKEGYELATNSLESFSKGIRLLNIH